MGEKMGKTQQNWIPEIMYEETEDGLSSHIPFIMVPKNEIMPVQLFIFENKKTGEFEPGADGEMLPIHEMELYQYANMNYLKSNLSIEVYDQVRKAMGLKPMKEAAISGKKITEKIRKNVT